MMCQDLTSELAQFDLLKEQELKQILLAYVTAQLEAQEKVRKHYVCRPKSLQCRHMFMYTVAHIHKNPYYIPPPSLPPSLLLSFLSPSFPPPSLTSLLQSKSKWFSLTVILDTPIKPDARAIQFKTAESEDTSQ